MRYAWLWVDVGLIVLGLTELFFLRRAKRRAAELNDPNEPNEPNQPHKREDPATREGAGVPAARPARRA